MTVFKNQLHTEFSVIQGALVQSYQSEDYY